MIDRRKKVLRSLGKIDYRDNIEPAVSLRMEVKLGMAIFAADCPQMDRMLVAGTNGTGYLVDFINYTPFSIGSHSDLIRLFRSIL